MPLSPVHTSAIVAEFGDSRRFRQIVAVSSDYR